MITTTLLWMLSITLIVLGIMGSILPVLPGAILVFIGIAIGAWIDDFSRVSHLTLSIIGLLAITAWVLDYISGLLGAKKAGASFSAILGAAIGTVLGLFMGLIGILFMPLLGATLGEYLARRNQAQAIKVGIASWLGMLLGMLAKVVLIFIMVGVFITALIF